MSERYDAETLRAVAQTLRAKAERCIAPAHRTKAGVTRASLYREVATTLDDLATEAEAREPDLADWVAAATRSRLGAPHIEAACDRTENVLRLYWIGAVPGAVCVELDMDCPGVFIATASPRVRLRRTALAPIPIDTPAALTAALNAIADVKP